MTDLRKVKLLELFADRTVFGLDENEAMEVERLKKQFPDWEQDVTLELAAAAIGLSNLEVKEELPANLRAKIFAAADDYFQKTEESPAALNFTPPVRANAGVPAKGSVRNIVETTKISPWQWLGWAFAAAACLALAITLLTTRSNKTPEITKMPETILTPPPELSIEQKLQQVLATATDIKKIPLTNPKNEKEIVGEMVWSNDQQKGYARFTNLPVNDAAQETYQLWIVDEARDAKTPLSGGTFNVGKTGETVVPVNAQLEVKKPRAIAVTVEKPGGVVVSKSEKVVAAAKIKDFG